MRRFDRFAVPDETPLWPQQMEFSISNVCNLECIMCRGLWSSAIRARREKLPPLPRLYSEAFFESLWKYLPHVKQLKFLGGEPFLISEYYTLWDRMIDDGLAVPCHATTNGTQYNRKIERVLEHVPMGFAVSMDGATKATLESIRVNAKYEVVMENARRFREYARARKTSFSVTYCLMRQNWHEFGEFCLLADSWDCPVESIRSSSLRSLASTAYRRENFAKSSSRWSSRRTNMIRRSSETALSGSASSNASALGAARIDPREARLPPSKDFAAGQRPHSCPRP
jgi:sulfatase maturation enzyme AslB (radical SAM superfamily)